MFRPPNVVLAASSSGKMGKEHLNHWVEKVFVPSTGGTSMLVHDAWSCFTVDNIRKKIPDDKSVTLMQIPAGKFEFYQKLSLF